MQNRVALFVCAVGVFLVPVVKDSLDAQQAPQAQAQQQQQPQAGQPAPGRGRNGQGAVPDGAPGGGRAGGGRGRAAGPPPGPAPRNAQGRVLLSGATPKEMGVWIGGGGVGNRNTLPYQPWARAVSLDRQINELEPHTRCKASGSQRQFLTPYGAEIVELPEIQRIYIFDIGGPHTFREIFMDGRSHPTNLKPSYYGHSIGWWEGDTLVVDTKGFNEGFWIDRGAAPHTEQLHTVERYTRTDSSNMRYEMTVDDPGAYTKPWSGTMNLRWSAGVELFEYICQQQNYAHELMVGAGERVDRTTLIVP
jgi:hypothetical protein